jgi:hypothetical protein
MKKTLTAVFVLLLSANCLWAQNYRSRQNGAWSAATTWQVFVNGNWEDLETAAAAPYQNITPTSASGVITIFDNVSIGSGSSVSIDQTVVNSGGRITLSSGGTLSIVNTADALVVSGSIAANEGSSFTGTTGTNVVFNAGATYYHLFTTSEGVIPLATWDSDSELRVQGYTTFTTATAAGNWNQSFGHVTWNCSSQTSTVALAGLLRTITGNLEILNTNTATLQFSTNQRPTINISGDFQVEGTSAIVIATNAASPGAIVNVGADFAFMPTNASVSYLATTGTTTVNITGDFLMDAPGSVLYLANSTGSSGLGILNITGNFDLQSGTITEGLNDSASSNGRISFTTSGGGKLHTYNNTGTITNRITYRLPAATDTLQLIGESQLIGHRSSSYTQSGGVLIVESIHADGAIQTGQGTGNGNIRVATRTFATGSQIIYQGSAAQVIGNGQPSATSVVISNPSGVSLNNLSLATVSLAGLTIEQGNLTVENDNLSVNGTTSVVQLNGGDIIVNSSLATRTFTARDLILSGGDVILNGTTNAISLIVNGDIELQDGDITVNNTSSVSTINTFGDIDFSGGDIYVNSGTANATAIFRGDLTGTGFLHFSGTNVNLYLLGTGALSRDFPLDAAATIENFTLNRASSTVTFPFDLTVTVNMYLRDGNVTMNGDLAVVGDLNIEDNSILNFSDHSLTLSSQFNTSLTGGELFANSNSILTLDGSGAVDTLFFATGGNILSKLVLDRPTSGTLLRLTTPLTIVDSLHLEDGIFDHSSGLTMSDGSVLLRNSAASMTGAIASGDYNLVYTGASLTTGVEAQGSLLDVTSYCTGTATLASALSAAGQLYITSGTFTSGTNAIAAASLLNDGIFNAPSTTLTLEGDFTNNGTFNKNAGTVIFNGLATIGGSSTTIFHSLDITAQGDLTPPATLELSGHFNNDGIYNDNDGLLLMSGSSRQDVTGSATTTLNNFTVSNTSAPYSVSVDGTVNLRGTLTLGPGAQFLADGVTTNGVFTVLSLDDQPSTVDGRIATIPASATVLGNVTVQRFMSGKTTRVNRYISSPVTGATVSDITSDYDVSEVKWYDETVSGEMINGYTLADGSDVLESGRGYLALPVTSNVTATWDVRGPLTLGENQGSVDFGITHTASSPVDVNGDGWNLVGNPYASGIGWGINSGWTRSNIGATITVRDLGGPSPKYKQYTYNGADGTGTLPNGVIAMGQAFWVWAAPGGGTLIVHESAKTGMSGTFYRERSPLSKQLIIALKNANGDEDNTFLKTNGAATEDFDIDFDAYQLKNEFLNISIYDKDSRAMLMHTLSEIPDDFVAPVEISASAPGQYTVSFEHAEQFLSGSELYFVDELEKVATPIHVSGSSYTFNIQSTAVDNSRFRLKRKAEFDNKGEFSVQLYPNPVSSELVLRTQGAQEVAVAVMDMKGNVLLQRTATHEAVFNVSDLPKGMYIVRVVSQDNVVVRKIVKD